MRTTLNALKVGDCATVIELGGAEEDIERLMELGMVTGTPLQVLKFAPLGGPLEILVRGYHLSLRRAEAAEVIVEI